VESKIIILIEAENIMVTVGGLREWGPRKRKTLIKGHALPMKQQEKF
jgi:hypothetical protein